MVTEATAVLELLLLGIQFRGQMSHFAEIDKNNIVIRVLVGDNNAPNEGYDWFVENLGGRWIQTSYNANFRNKFAAIGDKYDEVLDAFISPKPFRSWVFNEEDLNWEAPYPMPEDGKEYRWSEFDLDWVEIPKEEE